MRTQVIRQKAAKVTGAFPPSRRLRGTRGGLLLGRIRPWVPKPRVYGLEIECAGCHRQKDGQDGNENPKKIKPGWIEGGKNGFEVDHGVDDQQADHPAIDEKDQRREPPNPLGPQVVSEIIHGVVPLGAFWPERKNRFPFPPIRPDRHIG